MNYLGQNPWTPEEDELLRKLAASGESAASIAKRLNRNIPSIRNRVSRLNIALAKSRTLKIQISK
jgi:DNA-binding NarL/FixJ family response regulator